ncbi:MAG: sulfatase-like hydrolase/transferase [Endomicrobiaceae bacterium]|nr:sulfatase-like hydrolase/transferase [Endomicrobiaceae bacterium]
MEKKFYFNTVLNSFIILIPIKILMIIMMTLYRFIFFVYFADLSTVPAFKAYILQAFWMGFRFDLSILAYINSPVTLGLLICLLLKVDSIFKLAISFFRHYYNIIFSLLFLVMFVDFGFFSYFKDHYNFLIFGFFEDDTIALIKTITADYRVYVVSAIFAVLCTLIYKVSYLTYQKLKLHKLIINAFYWKTPRKVAVVLLILFVNFIEARGSFSMFPLGLFHSQISPNYFINKVCVNPVHPLADTIYYKIKNSKNTMNLKDKFGYKNDQDILNDLKISSLNADIKSFADMLAKKTSKNKIIEEIRPNVILIVLEGFGEMPVLNNSKQFDVLGELKEHFEQDTVFNNFLPAGFITIHAIESIILNVPQRPFSNQITQTPYSFKYFPSSAVIPYKKAGYDTIALYGGSMTWRDLESFFKSQGFDEIIGEGNVKVKAKDRHAWGINDDQFFKLLKKYLFDGHRAKQKFIYAMSTGTHPPYKRPKGYMPLPLEIPNNIQKMMSVKDLNNKEIFELYQFANRELAKFISDVKKSEFANNTIIAVTGDHNLREISNYSKEDLFLKYAVPFYLYIPEQLKNKNMDVSIVGSHMDIMPTLYNLSLNNADYISFGNDLLNISDNISFNMDGLVIKDTVAIKYNFIDDSIQSFNFDKKTKKLLQMQETDVHRNLKRYYKAIMTLCDIFVKS